MLTITPGAIKESLLQFLEEFWSINHDFALALACRPLKQKADEVSAEILKLAITDHLLYDILKYVLHDIADHCAAIDAIGKNRTMLLHVRHIEELYTVSKYLFASPERYSELAWRWNSFNNLHAIRNRVLNLKQPLDPQMTAWLKTNLGNMQQFFSKKFDLDPTNCTDQWEKLSNWLYKIPLSEIFEKAERLDSYTSAAYDWNSQAVHLSPLGDTYMAYELRHQDFGDFAIDSVCTYLHKMCHECSSMVADQERLRKFYLRQVLLETYEMLCNRPKQYIDLADKGNQHAMLTELLLRKTFNFDDIMIATLGPQPKDPLVLNLKS